MVFLASKLNFNAIFIIDAIPWTFYQLAHHFTIRILIDIDWETFRSFCTYFPAFLRIGIKSFHDPTLDPAAYVTVESGTVLIKSMRTSGEEK